MRVSALSSVNAFQMIQVLELKNASTGLASRLTPNQTEKQAKKKASNEMTVNKQAISLRSFR